ncbi:MAG: sterol desaturase family protein [Bacteroidia bacterium]
MSLVYANGFLLLLVLTELFVISVYKKEQIPWREVVFNINSGHILMWVLRGVEIGAFHFVSTYWNYHLLADWNYLSIWIFAFIAWDFCFYWLHRFHHKFKFLWAVHVVHHEGEHFSLSLGIRNSWYSSLTSFPFFIGLAIIGVPVEVFIATSSINYFVQFYNHNHLVKNSGWLEKIMITPAHHRVHHGLNPEYIDRNFGGTFIFWDKLFGTFQPEIKTVPIIYGTKKYEKNYDVFWANNLPFLKLFKIPIPQKKEKSRPYFIQDYFIATGGLLIFGLLLYYISIEKICPEDMKLEFFGIIFLGTIANGGISEYKYWGLVLWFINFLVLAPLFILDQHITNPVLLTLFGLLVLHSFWLLTKTKYSD